MTKKKDNNSQNKDQQKRKHLPQSQQQEQAPIPQTPQRKNEQQENRDFMNMISPFQIPPKFVHLTAESPAHFLFSHDMRVIQTPYQPHPNVFQHHEIQGMNDDLRKITGKIDWQKTPAKSEHQSGSQCEQSQNPSSDQMIEQEIEKKSQAEEKLSESQQNPQKQPAQQRQRQQNARSQRQRNFSRRASHQKKLLEQFTVPEPNSLGKKVYCNCKKTKCLKLYCDCFRINQTCEGCNCVGCHNLQEYAEQRNNAILVLMDRNPDPFSQKIHDDKHLKGCNCKKSYCLKKYCECYQAGLKCGQNCKCDECKNGGGSEKRQQDRLQREGREGRDDQKEQIKGN